MNREIVKITRRHVPEHSPEVEATKRKRQEEITKDSGSSRIMGDYAIAELDRLRSELQRCQAGDPEIWCNEKNLQSLIDLYVNGFNGTRKMLTSLAGSDNPVHRQMVVNLYNEFTQSKYAADYADQIAPYYSLTTEDQPIVSNELPLELVEVLMRAHVEHYRQLEREAKERFIEYRREFVEVVEKDIAAGIIPISKELLNERVNQVGMVLGDTFQNYEGALGEHAEWQIKITPGMTPEQERHVVFHEFTHAISGMKFTKVQTEYADPILNRDETFDTKTGLRFIIPYLDADGKPRGNGGSLFRFLNEAITERLAAQWAGVPPDKTLYQTEQMAMDIFLNAGVSWQTLLNAYFENPEIDRTGDHPVLKMPKLVAFIREVNQKCGPKHLMKVEAVFKK